MLRDRHEQSSAWPDHAEQLAEHAPVVIDVFEDVENSDCIIVPRDGKVTRIGLDEWHVGKPRTRGAQPIRIEIGFRRWRDRPSGVQLREDEAIAASDLEEAVDLREVAGERPLDQAAARSEPEAIGFQVREWFERAPRIGGSRVDTGLVCEECNIAAMLREQPGPISVVVPVYGDGRALGDLTTRLQRVLEPIAPWKLILVNDGSPPPAWDRICHLASSHTFVKALDLQRNAGQHSALLAGIRASTGDVVVTMDDDLQHPPEAILDLLRQLHESGDDVVYGTPCEPVRGQRRQFGGSVARWIVAFVSGVPQAQVVSALQSVQGNAARGPRRAGRTSGVHRRRVVPGVGQGQRRAGASRAAASWSLRLRGAPIDRGRRRHDSGVRHPARSSLPAAVRWRSIGCRRRRAVAALTGPSSRLPPCCRARRSVSDACCSAPGSPVRSLLGGRP